LWPPAYPISALDRIRMNTQPPRNWFALFQQRPTPGEGEMFVPDRMILRRHTDDVYAWVDDASRQLLDQAQGTPWETGKGLALQGVHCRLCFGHRLERSGIGLNREGFPNRRVFDSTCWLGGGQRACRKAIRRICAIA
jgi:hypothetical protein